MPEYLLKICFEIPVKFENMQKLYLQQMRSQLLTWIYAKCQLTHVTKIWQKIITCSYVNM